MNELWLPVCDYESRYEVSNKGRVRAVERFTMRKGHPMKVASKEIKLQRHGDYKGVMLCAEGRIYKAHYVHVLVLEAHLRRRPLGLVGDHIDGDRHNNALENLQWISQGENVYRAGGFKTTRQTMDRLMEALK